MTKPVNIKRFVGDTTKLGIAESGIDSAPDAQLGFPAYAYKDGAGNLRKMLAKNEKVVASGVQVSALSTGVVTVDGTGNFSSLPFSGFADYRVFTYDPTTDPEENFLLLKAAVAAAKAAVPAPSADDPVMVVVQPVEHDGGTDYLTIGFSHVTLYCREGAKRVGGDTPSWANVTRAKGQILATYTGYGAVLITAPYVTLGGIDTDVGNTALPSLVVQFDAGAIDAHTVTLRNCSIGGLAQVRTATRVLFENTHIENNLDCSAVVGGTFRDSSACSGYGFQNLSAAVIERCQIAYVPDGTYVVAIGNTVFRDCSIVGSEVYKMDAGGSVIGAGVAFERCTITCTTFGYADTATGYNPWALYDCSVTYTGADSYMPVGDGGTIQGGRYSIPFGSGASIRVREDTGPIINAVIRNTSGYAQCIAAGADADFSSFAADAGKLVISGCDLTASSPEECINPSVPYEGGNTHNGDAPTAVDQRRLWIDTAPQPDIEWHEISAAAVDPENVVLAEYETTVTDWFGDFEFQFAYFPAELIGKAVSVRVAAVVISGDEEMTVQHSIFTTPETPTPTGYALADIESLVSVTAEFDSGYYRVRLIAGLNNGAAVGAWRYNIAAVPAPLD